MEIDTLPQRVKMVDSQLRTTGVTSTPILDAFLSVPREAFVGEGQRSLAYIDEDLRVAEARDGAGPRYIMEPSPFAKLVQLAGILPGDTVLDVGCATGYSTAVLCRLAASVVALESDAALADQAASILAAQGCDNVTVAKGPLPQGHAAAAPYDVIFVGGSVEKTPDALFAQLAEGGRLVVVEGRGNSAWARLYLKTDGVVTGRSAFNAAIKSLPGFESVHTFKF